MVRQKTQFVSSDGEENFLRVPKIWRQGEVDPQYPGRIKISVSKIDTNISEWWKCEKNDAFSLKCTKFAPKLLCLCEGLFSK